MLVITFVDDYYDDDCLNLGCCNRLGGLTNKHLFLKDQSTERLSVWWEPASWIIYVSLLAVSSHGVKKARALLTPKSLPPNISLWG